MDNIETTISERELESRQQLIKNAQIGFQQYTDAYQEEWQRMTHSPISELAYPLTEVIQRRGNIPLHMFMAHALYGLDGYYSTGRALPNAGDFSTPSGNFASVFSLLSLGYDRLPYLPETMAIIGSGRGHFEKNTIRAETVTSALEPLPQPHIFSVDYSYELLHTHAYPETVEAFTDFTLLSRDRSPIHRVSASVSQLPFSAESFDIVQSVELFDSLPPVCFLIGKLGAKLLPQVTYKDGAFDLTLSPVDPSLLPLLRLKQTYNKQQKQTPLNVGRYQLVTCNVDAINVLSEISRVLRPGGVTLITDYVDEQPVGNYFDYIYFAAYNEQGKLGWDNYIFEQIADYSFPYQDISAQTEPLFLSWIGHTYGLSTDVFQSLESVKRMYFAPPDNKNDHRFRVTVLKKDN